MGQNDDTRANDEKNLRTDLHEGGEGNIDADRRYRAGVAATVESGKVEELAEEAREALEGAEGESLREAEQKAKDKTKPTAGDPRPA